MYNFPRHPLFGIHILNKITHTYIYIYIYIYIYMLFLDLLLRQFLQMKNY